MRKIHLKDKRTKRKRLHRKIRSKIFGSQEIPRLAVFRSNRFIYAQLIDDNQQRTLAQATDLKSAKPSDRVTSARKVGEILAERALGLGIKKVVFDRGGFSFAGRVKALAEGARTGGLEF